MSKSPKTGANIDFDRLDRMASVDDSWLEERQPPALYDRKIGWLLVGAGIGWLVIALLTYIALIALP